MLSSMLLRCSSKVIEIIKRMETKIKIAAYQHLIFFYENNPYALT